MAGPVVAVIGSTGYVGKFTMPTLLEALKAGKLKELRVLAAAAKLNKSEELISYGKAGAKLVPVDYTSASSLTTGFKGADIALSFLGTNDNVVPIWKLVLDALVVSGVQVYFPSEYDANLLNGPAANYEHRAWTLKRGHFQEAKRKGLNPIRIVCGPIMETNFIPQLGLDCVSKKWKLVKGAADVPCTMTSQQDIAQFLLQAVLLAHKNLSKVPDELEIYSEVRTLRQYAAALDKVSGGKIEIEDVDYNTAKENYKKSGDFLEMCLLLFAEAAFDFSKSPAIQLLNPNQSVWKLKTFEDFAKETGGVPKPAHDFDI